MTKRSEYTPSYRQIANVLGCSEQNIKQIMSGRYGSKKKIERVQADYAERLKSMEEEMREEYRQGK